MKTMILCCCLWVAGWALDSFPIIAVNGDGDAVAVWTANVMGVTMVRAAKFDGSWQASTSASDANSFRPDVALNTDGDIVGVWSTFISGSGFQISTALSTIGGMTFTSKSISMQMPPDLYPQVTLDSSGNGVAVWQSNGAIFGAALMSDTWNTPYQISSGSSTFSPPHLAMNPTSGDAIALWQRIVGLNAQTEAAFLPSGGSWGEPELLSDTTNATSAQIACGSSGQAIAIWQQEGEQTITIQAKVRSAGVSGTWDHPFSHETSANFKMPQIGVNGSGAGLAIWVGVGSGGQWIETVVYNPMTGEWGNPAQLGSVQNILQFPQIAINDSGRAVAVWNSEISGQMIVQAATRSSGGVWSSIHSFSSETSDSLRPSVGIDSAGNALVVWQQGDGNSPTTIKAARFNGTSWSASAVIGTVNP